MRAIAKCPKCGETITTNCKECIEGEVAVNLCGCDEDVIQNVKWKIIDKTEPSFEEEMGWKFGEGKKDGPINQIRKLNKGRFKK